jgi:hypothetical protein
MMRAVAHTRSERPPSVRQVRRLRNGTLVTSEYDRRGRVVSETYYWSPDEALMARILNNFSAPVDGTSHSGHP